MQIVGVRVWTFLLGHPNLFSNSPYHTHLQRVNAHLSDQEEFSALSQTSINTTNTKISGWKDGNLPGEIKQEKWEDSSVPYKLCWGSQFGIIFLGVKTLGILWKYQRQHPRQDNMFLIWVLLFLLFFFPSFVLCLFFFLFFVHSSFPLFSSLLYFQILLSSLFVDVLWSGGVTSEMSPHGQGRKRWQLRRGHGRIWGHILRDPWTSPTSKHFGLDWVTRFCNDSDILPRTLSFALAPV